MQGTTGKGEPNKKSWSNEEGKVREGQRGLCSWRGNTTPTHDPSGKDSCRKVIVRTTLLEKNCERKHVETGRLKAEKNHVFGRIHKVKRHGGGIGQQKVPQTTVNEKCTNTKPCWGKRKASQRGYNSDKKKEKEQDVKKHITTYSQNNTG